MNVIALLRRLTGSDERHRTVDSEFRACLSGVDSSNLQLDDLNRQLDEVLIAVSQRQSQIAVSNPPPSAILPVERPPKGGPPRE